MNREDSKTLREIERFSDFVRAGNLPIDLNTVEKRQPPEPDILCMHAVDGPLAFELTEVCDPNFAKLISGVHKGEVEGGVYCMRTSDPSPIVIKKKLLKNYITEHPIELLCYTDGRVGTPDDVMRSQLLVQLAPYKGQFRCVWLMHSGKVQCVWVVEEKER